MDETAVRVRDAAREGDLQHHRASTALARETAAADAEARRQERAAKRQARELRRLDRAARRRDRRTATVAVGRTLRPVVPLLIVNAFAVFGQVLYGLVHYSPVAWPLWARLVVAIGAAIGIESIGNYVNWHAHDALLMKATATAARLRRASYLIALGVAGINYAHFADGWAPTPAAIVFALFSAASPWLWGLHTRRAHQIQLLREGQIDSQGAVFSAERWRAFPVRTWSARRWSIDLGVDDPRAAWAGYNTARAERAAERALKREARLAASAAKATDMLPDRRGLVDITRDGAIVEDLRALEIAHGRRYKREHLKDMYGIGSTRAERVLGLLGWFSRAEVGAQ